MPQHSKAMKEEIERSFPDCDAHVVAHRADLLWTRCMMEELLLDQLDASSVQQWMVFEGREHLDAALERKKGVLLLFPHAGNVMLLIALLSMAGYDLTQMAARGFHPDDSPSWFAKQARQAREQAEDRLPAKFITPHDPPRLLYRALERNGILALTFDGRAGKKFVLTPFLEREALLSTGPVRLAVSTGATVVPAMCLFDGRIHRLHLCPPRVAVGHGSRAERCERLFEDTLRRDLEPLLQKYPDHYA
ncbi:MAG: lysophospholipid acyltransferase family protein, partial [Proteobacteria bacterium]|nr:lysophospholipid acyltransferase family protein [Pseudomonadota bacterium]